MNVVDFEFQGRVFNGGALILRIGLSGILYYTHSKEPQNLTIVLVVV